MVLGRSYSTVGYTRTTIMENCRREEEDDLNANQIFEDGCDTPLGEKDLRQHATCTMILMISGFVRNELKQKSLERSRKSWKSMNTVPCSERKCFVSFFHFVVEGQINNGSELFVPTVHTVHYATG